MAIAYISLIALSGVGMYHQHKVMVVDYTLYKSGQCSPKHKICSNLLCHMIEETFSHSNILKFPENVSLFLYLGDY